MKFVSSFQEKELIWIASSLKDLRKFPGNPFADLQLPQSEDLLAKAELARRIASIIRHRHLTQIEAAQMLGTTQPKVSALLRGQLSGFAMERLIRFLNALGRDVHIVVKPKPRGREKARLSVIG